MKDLIIFLLLGLSLRLTIANVDINLDAPNLEKKWVTIKGTPTMSYSGRVVRNIGDFNGDGIDDMVINTPNNLYAEVAYVVYGQKDGYSKDTIPVNAPFPEGFTIKGPFINSVFSSFGYSISKAIDLNGDGLSDIVIGAPGFSNSQGIVYVVYGKKGHTGDIIINQDLSFSSAQGFVIFGPQASSQLGVTVASARDFNGDGFDDLLIGAPGYGSPLGVIYVFYGKKGNYATNIYLNESLSSQQVFKIVGSVGNNCTLGMAAEGVGDINGDGIDDILVGTSLCSNVYGLYGKKNRIETMMAVDSNLDPFKGFVISGGSLGAQFGGIVSSAGDINGDGIGDIILGAFAPVLSRGTFVFYGRKENWSSFAIGSDLTPYQGFIIKDSRNMSRTLGGAVSGGDINGDGIDDIVLRARNFTIGGGGYVAVIYGSPTVFSGEFDISTDLTVDKGFIISGSDLNFQMILASLATGDLNDDNIDDLIIGAPQAESGSGRAYIVFGANECPKNCSTCQSSRCLTCFKGYGLYDEACIGECPTGTSLLEGICQECPDDCIQCRSSTKCQVCAEGYSLSDSQICISGSQAAQAALSTGLFDGASAISNSLALGSSVPTNFGLVSKILRNTKYLNVSVSKDLQVTFNSWKITTGIFPAPDAGNSDSQGPLPLVFERYEMKSAFLYNYWKSFMMIIVGLGCFLISKSAEIIFSKRSSVSKVTRTVNVMASNFVLTQFYGSIDDILFYFVLDLRSGRFTSSGFRSFGFILGLLLMLTGFVVTGLHGVILFRYQRVKKKQEGGRDAAQANFLLQFLKKYENMKLFYQDFKDIDVFQQAFLLINITRSILSSFIFTMLYRYPLLQILLLITLNICTLVYLYMKKPFKNSSNAYAQYFCEGILLLAYLSILVLAFMDEAESEASNSIKGFSMVVIISNMALLIGSAVFMLVNIAVILYEIHKERRHRRQKPASPSRKDIASIPTILGPRIDSNKKVHSNISDMIVETSFQSNNTMFVHSKNLDNSRDYFQNNSSSPNLGLKRKIRRETIQRNTHSPTLKLSVKNEPSKTPDPFMHPSSFLNSIPLYLQLERGDSSLMQFTAQNSLLLNPEGVQEESALDHNNTVFEATMRDREYSIPMGGAFHEGTARNISGTVAGERGEVQFGMKKAKIKKIRR